MNWKYISGFFDADGSVTLCRVNKGKRKTIQLSFHNNEESILKLIRDFIEKETGYRGSLRKKKARKSNHKDSYDLSYKYKSGLIIGNRLTLIHPKKIHRINVYNKIQNVTPRNGKYTEELDRRRDELEGLFWNH